MDPVSTFDFWCLVVAFALFGLAALGVTARRINLVALGLAAFVLPFLIAAASGH